jgi:hypothetical protein
MASASTAHAAPSAPSDSVRPMWGPAPNLGGAGRRLVLPQYDVLSVLHFVICGGTASTPHLHEPNMGPPSAFCA